MKTRNQILFFKLTILSAGFLLFLAGCASFPIQQASNYTKNLYRRIPYTVEGNYRVMNIFYATSRQINSKVDDYTSFNNGLATGITCGNLTVKIDPEIKIGKMLPKRLERKGLIGIQEVKTAKEDAFMQGLADAVKTSPHNSLLVIVFGYKDDFEATAIKAAYFTYLLDVNTPVLLFDWPGDQLAPVVGYKKAQSYAAASGAYLGELLSEIISKVRPGKLWVKASSLGCQVVCDAFDHMYKYDHLSDKELEIDHVVFAAPDVGEGEFDEQFKNEIASLSEKLTTYVSSNDEALLLSSLINDEKRLGRQKAQKHEQLEETKAMLYLKSLDPDRISLVDVTPINNSSYKHGYYLESPEFYNDLYMRLFGEKPNANRCLYLLKVSDGTDYWVLRNSE
jgi:esterase/lipase superfamily enzyme